MTDEENLGRLKSSVAASSPSNSLPCQKLDGLKNLYECLDDVLQLPLSQQALSYERIGKWEEEVLDGYLRLLDICGAVRDIYLLIKESLQELESSLRWKRSGDWASEVSSYMISNKHLNKITSKCYRELKKAEKNCNLAVVNKDSAMGHKSQPRGWSLMSKLMQHKRPSHRGDSEIAAIEQIEIELHLLNNNKSNKDVLKKLVAVDSSIEELAEVLEIVFRLLLKTRVSLLNILNHQSRSQSAWILKYHAPQFCLHYLCTKLYNYKLISEMNAVLKQVSNLSLSVPLLVH
ncbi:uncharacterized protein LOC113766237 [Coffea eugenioides]|uniref:uncharacterized protein LOC113766237 n=1 Tax=Coffea eugenioides TaxID=49369 RepID=UPI000F60F279|nr:uncharacterized protein LOC113766237 [Coffea eugenioides]